MNLWIRELQSKSNRKTCLLHAGLHTIPAFLTAAENSHTWGLLLRIPVQSPRNQPYFLLDHSISTIQTNTNVQCCYDFCLNSRSNPLFASDFLPTDVMYIFNLYLCIFFAWIGTSEVQMIKGLLQIREKRTDSEVWRPHASSEFYWVWWVSVYPQKLTKGNKEKLPNSCCRISVWATGS